MNAKTNKTSCRAGNGLNERTPRAKSRMIWFMVMAVALTCTAPFAQDAEKLTPADPNLIPEARRVLEYFQTIYGKKVLAGQNGWSNAQKAREVSGKWPAILNGDLCGWHQQRWSQTYKRNLRRSIDRLIAWQTEKNGLVTITWHWANPLSQAGTYQATKGEFEPILDVGEVVSPGSAAHKAAMEDLARHADYLEKLAQARVPVLWRPLHEIDGGWFWWTDETTPENTAALYRMLFDYLVKERGLHNLIWVYNAGLKAGPKDRDVEAIEYRKRFYPGDAYVDISGIDIYPNEWFGWPDYRKSGYPRAFAIMEKVTPGKMLALSEGAGIPNPDLMKAEGPRWLYSLPWWGPGEKNPASWVKETLRHDLIITLDELPSLQGRETSASEKE